MRVLEPIVSAVGARTGLEPPVVLVWIGMLVVLAAGSAVRLMASHLQRSGQSTQRLGSLASWWGMVLLWTLALLTGPYGVLLLMALVSALALHEFVRLTGIGMSPPGDRAVIFVAYGLIPLQYGGIATGRTDLALGGLPSLGLMAFVATMVLRDRPAGFIGSAGAVLLGVWTTIYLLSFTAMLPFTATVSNPAGGAVGWVVLLTLLTTGNDIFQAWVGRAIGRRTILPAVSPRKTWAGLVGGLGLTTALAACLGPVLTSLPVTASAAAGVLVALAGFGGDVLISAVKRDRGARDSGTMLPGQGGILDRVDSYLFAAPVFYFYVRWCSFAAS